MNVRIAPNPVSSNLPKGTSLRLWQTNLVFKQVRLLNSWIASASLFSPHADLETAKTNAHMEIHPQDVFFQCF